MHVLHGVDKLLISINRKHIAPLASSMSHFNLKGGLGVDFIACTSGLMAEEKLTSFTIILYPYRSLSFAL